MTRATVAAVKDPSHDSARHHILVHACEMATCVYYGIVCVTEARGVHRCVCVCVVGENEEIVGTSGEKKEILQEVECLLGQVTNQNIRKVSYETKKQKSSMGDLVV